MYAGFLRLAVVRGSHLTIEMTPDLVQVFDNLPTAEDVKQLAKSIERGELENTLDKMARLRTDLSNIKEVEVADDELELVKELVSKETYLSYSEFVQDVKPLFADSTEQDALVELVWQFHRLSYNAWRRTWDVRADITVKEVFDLSNPPLTSALLTLLEQKELELELVM